MDAFRNPGIDLLLDNQRVGNQGNLLRAHRRKRQRNPQRTRARRAETQRDADASKAPPDSKAPPTTSTAPPTTLTATVRDATGRDATVSV